MEPDPALRNITEDTMTRSAEPDCGRSECEVRLELSRLDKKINQLLEWVNGNGQMGIKTRLALLEAQVAAIRWLMKVLIGALIGLSVSGIGGAIVAYLRIRGG